MAASKPTQPVRGTRDLLPAECALRDAATAKILDVYRRHGFARIETPVLEHMELLGGSGGGENEKLIYKVLKRGEKLDLSRAGLSEDDLVDCGLRFDLTVPLARYCAAHQAELPAPFKAIQFGPVFRAERPQKGRFRQFTQCDIDILGEAGPAAEAQLIAATVEALAAFRLPGLVVRVNDRRLLRAVAQACGVSEPAAQERLFVVLDKLDKIGAEGVRGELVAQGLPAASADRLLEIMTGAPGAGAAGRGESGLAALRAFAARVGHGASIAALESIFGALADAAPIGNTLRFDPTLVRGMGYYTGPIFEIGMEGVGYSLAGGGRYDEMIGAISGRAVPACGFSIGFERLVLELTHRGWVPDGGEQRVALLHDEADELRAVLVAATRLRAEGLAVSVIARRKKAGKQYEELQQQGFAGAANFVAGAAPELRWFEAR